MRVLYANGDKPIRHPVEVPPGGFVLILDPDEAYLQEMIVRGFLPMVERHTKQQLLEILQYVCVSHEGCNS